MGWGWDHLADYLLRRGMELRILLMLVLIDKFVTSDSVPV